MSLINQALKQEQRRRNLDAAGLRPGMSGYPRAAAQAGNSKTVLLVGFAGLGLLLAVSLSVFLYYGAQALNETDEAASSFAAASATSSQAAPVPEPAPAAPPTPAASEQVAPSPERNDVISQLSPQELAALKALLAQSQSAQETEPERPQRDPVLQEHADSLQIQGIRKLGDKSRILIGGKLFKIGDEIDLETGLKFVGFTDTHVILEDARGARYLKQH